MSLSVVELQCAATDLKASVGLIGRIVKDIVKKLAEDQEIKDPGFVTLEQFFPAIEAKLKIRHKNFPHI